MFFCSCRVITNRMLISPSHNSKCYDVYDDDMCHTDEL